MRNITDFLPWVETHMMGVPRPLAERHLVDAARAFCVETQVIQIVPEPVSLEAGQTEYEVELDRGLDVVSVLEVWCHGRRLELRSNVTQQRASAYHMVGGGGGYMGSPHEAYVEEPPMVRVYPPAGRRQEGALQFKVSVCPVRDARRLPARLYEDWGPVIGLGAVRTLAVIPGQAFTNGDIAGYAAGEFAMGVRRGKAQAYNGRVRGRTRVKAHPLA